MAPAIVGNLSPADGEPLFSLSEMGEMVGVGDESTSIWEHMCIILQLKMMLRNTIIEGMFATFNQNMCSDLAQSVLEDGKNVGSSFDSR